MTSNLVPAARFRVLASAAALDKVSWVPKRSTPFLGLDYLEEVMMRRLLFSSLAGMVVYGFAVAFAPSALAASCDVNACISACQKKCATPGCACPQNCMQGIEKRKQAGQCK